MIRIVLVDDHALVRDGLGRLLEAQPDMRIVGSFGDGDAAVALAAREQPDVAILDISMPGPNGIDTARRLLEVSRDLQVLFLSMHANPEYVRQALEAGALGYVVKESAGRVLVEAVRAVHAGRRYLPESIGEEALRRLAERAGGRAPLERLSAREREVLKLTVEGLTSAETAASLGISPKSVETYRGRIMSKLDVEDLPALVKFAIRHGVTTLE